MFKFQYQISLFFFLIFLPFILSSVGDKSPFYQNCLANCRKENCTADGYFQEEVAKLRRKQSSSMRWNCEHECRYDCMWKTVEGFQKRGLDIPKFHGKWPFKRFMGIQEPASTFASLLNLMAHMHMYSEMVKEFPIEEREVPLVGYWHVFALICKNAWMWSMIFHSKDNFFTEFMDYAGALSMVMSLFLSAVIRMIHKRRILNFFVILFALLYYIEHVRYLYSGRIDYDYNMRVNIYFGLLGSLLWLGWACVQFVAGRRYVWRLIVFIFMSGASLILELYDFPPVYGWDAHALWHLSTAPLPFLFYRFVIDDLIYLEILLEHEKSD